MSSAQIWAALQQSSMVGADRLPVPAVLASAVDASAPVTEQALQAALSTTAPGSTASAAEQLLRASAIAAVMERTGWVPGSQVQVAQWGQISVAAPESRPATANERLKALMQDVLQDGPPELLAPMLLALDKAGQRLPHALLVQALDQGRQSIELRRWLTPVLGERGRWLAGLNPQWNYASGVQETANPEQIWQEGSLEQRVDLLRQERRIQPAQARERLQASLKELSAKERLPMVQALALSLSMDDEPLLEKLLSDRGKEVRETAARLLSSLPESAHSLRIMGWMRALLQQDEQGQWVIEPAEQGLKEWERDGITLQPPSYIKGVKAWLLQQLVALTPLVFWTETLQLTPVALMEWSRLSDWKSALRQGWLEALGYQHDGNWIDAAELMGRDLRDDTLMPALMAQLTDEQREARWSAQLNSNKAKLLMEAIASIERTLGPQDLLSAKVSALLVERLEIALGGPQVGSSWHYWEGTRALLTCAEKLSLDALPRFADLWRKPRPSRQLAVANADDGAQEQPVAEVAEADGVDGAAQAEVANATNTSASSASPTEPKPLTAEQQARLERSRRRPWDDDEQLLAQLNRIVDLRLALHEALHQPGAHHA